jgi:hypothetical protein
MRDTYICLFKIEYYDDINGETKQECGFAFAENFSQAVDYLEKELYGDNLKKIVYLELFDTCPILSEDIWIQMLKELTTNEC